MAPNVNLLLYTIANSVDFNNAVDDARLNGTDIITASLGFPTLGGNGTTGFFRDGTTTVAKKVDEARNDGILVTISAGNQGDSHWMGNYVNSTTVTPTDIGLGASGYQTVMEFQPSLTTLQNACLPVTDNGDFYVASWDAWEITTQDYDFFLYNSNMTLPLLGFSTIFQSPGGDFPIEIIPGGLPAGGACLVLASFSSTQDHFFHIDAESNLIDSSLLVRNGSIGTPADAIGALAAGAINVGTDALEVFSSSGPTDDGRSKPEVCGPDNTFSHQSSLNPFAGTSASAPHIAGGAALLLNQTPGLSASQLQNELISTARFNSAYSIDNLCGLNSGALRLQTPSITETDSPIHSENNLLNTKYFVSDVPEVDGKSFLSHLPIEDTDMPSFSDAVKMLSSLSVTDEPIIEDSNVLNSDILVNDVPTIVETQSGIVMSVESLDDVPIFADTVVLLPSLSEVDAPVVVDEGIVSLDISVNDVPTIDDESKLNVDLARLDVPIFADTVVLLPSLSEVDAPVVVDEGIVSLDISLGDAPSVNDRTFLTHVPIALSDEPAVVDKVILTHLPIEDFDVPTIDDESKLNVDLARLDVPTFADTVVLLPSLSEVDAPVIVDKTFLTHLPISVSDIPQVLDSFNFNTDISANDTPTVSDRVNTSADISLIDAPEILEAQDTIKSGVERISEAPAVTDRVILSHQPISDVDIPTFVDANVMRSSHSVIDAPEVGDSVSMNVKISGNDVPVINDSKRSIGMPFLNDSPKVSDSAVLSHLPISLNDVPTFSDTVVLLPSLSATDVLTINDSVEGMGMPFGGDEPKVAESVSMSTVGLVGDTPEVGDSVVMNSDVSVRDIAVVDDSVEGMGMPFGGDEPEVAESVSMSTVGLVGDTPEVGDSVVMNSDVSVRDIAVVDDSVEGMGMPFGGDEPEVAESVSMSTVGLVGDTPEVGDSVVMNSDVLVNDVPTIVDDVEGMGTPSAGDLPAVADSVSFSTANVVEDAPEVVDSVVMNSDVLVSDSPTIDDNILGEEIFSIDEAPIVADSVSMNTDSILSDAPEMVDSVVMNSDVLVNDTPRVSDGAFQGLEPDEQGITNNQEEATATVEQPELVITSSDVALSIVNVPLEVTNAVLNYEHILNTDIDNNKIVSIENPLTVKAETSFGNVDVEFPADLTITGASEWTGEVHLPQIKDPTSVIPPPGQTVDSVIELGFDDIEITFDKAVRIVLEGQAGKTAFFERSGVTTVINNVCSADSFDVVNSQLSEGGIEECKINNDGDLVIWTLHFTLFGSSTSIPGASPTSSPGTTSSGGSFSSGGGGGGSKYVIMSGGIEGSSGGIISEPVHLYEVSWDKCVNNNMRIVAGPSDENLLVKLRTASSGLVEVNLVEEQTFDSKSVYEAVLDPSVNFVHIQVERLSQDRPALAQKSIELNECEGNVIVFSEPEKPIFSVIEQTPLIASLLEKISPRNQIAIGISPDSVICREGLELIFKATNGSPACVTSETLIKLVQRGWAR